MRATDRFSAAGSAANGIVWASDWVPGAPFGSVSNNFTKAYKATYHTAPNDWAAESYDAAFYAARAIKAAELSLARRGRRRADQQEGKRASPALSDMPQVRWPGARQARSWSSGKDAAVSMTNQNPS